MQVEFLRREWPFKTPFRIAYDVHTSAETIQVVLIDGPHIGRGEAVGVGYRGENVDSMLGQLEALRNVLSKGISQAQLTALLPPGGARNAVDCALWDLQAKRTGKRAWELVGIRSVNSLTTDYTIGLDSPQAMARTAATLLQHGLFKLKLSGEGDLERVLAVRTARPDAALIVDANQSWTEGHLRDLTLRFQKMGVKLIEQPLPVGKDEALLEFQSPVPLCADESCQTAESLSQLVGKYQYVNVKLDKTGGLTEALHLAREAEAQGFKLMIGCMAGSSLSMAPAFIVGQLCDFVDLDGPLLSARDTTPPIRYVGGQMYAPERELWG
jgi:L-alanine-DL-glutamate epimerase-like enolase superfamily enzyme